MILNKQTWLVVVLAVGLVVSLVAASQVVASMRLSVTVDQFIAESDLIIVGRVLSHSSEMREMQTINNANGKQGTHNDVFTDWQVEVLEQLKGELDTPSVVVTSPGGIFGGHEVSYSSGYKIDSGETVLMFLKWYELNGVWMAWGQSAGVFFVDDFGGEGGLRTVSSSTTVLSREDLIYKKVGNMLGATTLDDVRLATSRAAAE